MKPAAIGILTALVLAVPTLAVADTVINNGLAPPNPANVIDAGNTFPEDTVWVQNVGCDNFVLPSCPMPWGDPTSVELVDGGSVFLLRVAESSMITMSGGTVSGALGAYGASTVTVSGGWVSTFLGAYDSSTVAMSGGEVANDLPALDSSTVTMSGGSVGRDLVAHGSSAVAISGGSVAREVVALDSSTITIVGSGFDVDGVAVPYGPLAATSGTLTGTLESGDAVDNVFRHQGADAFDVFATGLIKVAPEANAAQLSMVVVLSLVALRAARRRAK